MMNSSNLLRVALSVFGASTNMAAARDGFTRSF